jgi:hypothetical protein
VSARKDVAILVGLGAVAAGLIAWLVERSGHARAAVLDAVPADSFLVATLDVVDVAESPLGAALVGDGGARATSLLDMASVQETCGFDPLVHLRAIALAVPEGGDHADFGIAASGDLGKDTLAKCAVDVIAKQGGKPTTRTSGDFVVVSNEAKSGSASLAFRDGGPYLVARGAWLERMMAAAEGHAPRIATSPEHAALRAELAKHDADAEALVVTAVVPRALRERIEGEMTARAAAEDGGTLGAPMEGVLGVSSAGLAIHAGRGANDEARLVAVFRCDTAAACKQVSDLVGHQRLLASGDLRLRLAGLGPLIDAYESRSLDPGTLLIQTHAPAAELGESLAKLLDRKSPGAHPR